MNSFIDSSVSSVSPSTTDCPGATLSSAMMPGMAAITTSVFPPAPFFFPALVSSGLHTRALNSAAP